MTRFRLTRLTVTLLSVAAALAWSSAPALAGGSDWKVGYYTPSSHGALSFASADRPAAGLADPQRGSPSDPRGRSLSLAFARRASAAMGGAISIEDGGYVLVLPGAGEGK